MNQTKMIKKLCSLFLLGVLSIASLSAQAADQDFMRSIGKIYIVVTVVAVIFFGIIFYLIYLDRKISKVEKSINDGHKTS